MAAPATKPGQKDAVAGDAGYDGHLFVIFPMAAHRLLGPAFRWSLCLALAVPLLSAKVGVAEPQPTDRWWARDKAIHGSVSAMLAGDGYAVASASTESPALRAVCGSAFALSLGLAKEFSDQARGRVFSWRDLTWDALGAATGTTVALLIDRYLLRNPRRTP
jgi:uncharacterized protein YfiM (DUF2279 family)